MATNYRFISFQMINMKKNSISFYLIQKFQGCFLFHHHLNVITTMRTGVWVCEKIHLLFSMALELVILCLSEFSVIERLCFVYSVLYLKYSNCIFDINCGLKFLISLRPEKKKKRFILLFSVKYIFLLSCFLNAKIYFNL